MRRLDHISATSDHELYRVIRAADDAQHALCVHAMYAKHEAGKHRGGRAGDV